MSFKMFYLLKIYFCNWKGRLSAEGSGSYGGKIQMAKIFEYRGRGISDQSCGSWSTWKKEGFIIVSVYRHPRELWRMDRSVIRKLSENLKAELSRERLRQRKYILPQVLPGLRAGKSVSLCESKQDTEHCRGKCHRLFSHWCEQVCAVLSVVDGEPEIWGREGRDKAVPSDGLCCSQSNLQQLTVSLRRMQDWQWQGSPTQVTVFIIR